MTIFCPSSHLVLAAARCPVCGWTRPPAKALGQPVWGPVELSAGLGGPGRGVYAQPAAARNVVVFPLRTGELAGINLADGTLRWRNPLPSGQMAQSLCADGDRLLLTLYSVNNNLMEASQPASLLALEPLNGRLTTLWQPGTHHLSPLTLTPEYILVRTSASELVALSRQAQPAPLWRRPLQATWAQAPFVAGELVLVPDGQPMQGEGCLQAYALADGRPQWTQRTSGLLSLATPPAYANGTVIIRHGHNTLAGLDLVSGKPLWSQDYERLYSNLITGASEVYFVRRGKSGSGQPGHYQLQALDPRTGSPRWEMPLTTRVRLLHLLDEDTLLTGDDDGQLHAYQLSTRTLLWKYILGSDEDPIQSELFTCTGRLLAGTYSGRLVALQTAATASLPADPDHLVEACDWRAAADAYALQGDLRRAAEIYAGQLHEAEKALALYDGAGLLREAAEYARAEGLHPQALEFYTRLGDFKSQGDVLREMGDELGAAQRYEQGGEYLSAAELYEQKNQPAKALEMYRKAGNVADVVRMSAQVAFKPSDIEFLVKKGRLAEAAQAAEKAGDLDWAAKIYQQMGDKDGEIEVLAKLVKEKSENWALERLVELAHARGRFQLEALALQRLDRLPQAAQAFHRAARQAEQVEPEREDKIARLYDQARALYDDLGELDLEKECWAKVVYFRHLPRIIVEGVPQKHFVEDGFNVLNLTIRNIGRGIAHEVRVWLGRGLFVTDGTNSLRGISRLSPSVHTKDTIHLRPAPNTFEDVPLRLEWAWKDKDGNEYQDHNVVTIYVRHKNETPTDTAPKYFYYNGPVIQADGGTVEWVGHDKVAGDQVAGDKLQDEAQKGDKIEIDRGKGVTLTPQEAPPPPRLCPTCHLPVKEEGEFCQECGQPLPAQD